jgi:hypothetical protein
VVDATLDATLELSFGPETPRPITLRNLAFVFDGSFSRSSLTFKLKNKD